MKKVFLVLLGLFLGCVFVFCMGSVSAWYNGDWEYRKQITIDHDMVDGDLSNFPVLFNITDSDVKNHVQVDFDDVLFTSDVDVLFNHQIERYDYSSGNMLVWVNISSLSGSVDTDIYMYYGNPSCSNQENVSGVWDNGFRGVYHLNESTGNGGKDSTVNNYDGIPVGLVGEVSGVIGYASDFDKNINDRVVLPFEYGSSGEYTIEMWVVTSGDVNAEQFLYCYDDVGQDVYTFLTLKSGDLSAFTYDGVGNYVTKSSISTDTVYYIVMTAKESDNLRLYVDGSYVGQAGIGSFFDYVIEDQNYIGSRSYAGGLSFDGFIDEVRISNINRSYGYVKTSFDNVNNDSVGDGFFVLGTEQRDYIFVNDSTDVRVTDMVLNGYVGAGVNMSCGFWVGTNTSVNHSYNVQNISVSGIYTSGESFSSSVTGLTGGQLYYVRAWGKNESGIFSSGEYVTVLLKAEAPTGVSAVVVNSTAINISWTNGVGSNRTVVVRKTTGYSGSINDGIVIGNTTQSYLVVDGLSNNDVFYYRLWSISNWTTADNSFYSQVSDNNTDVVYGFLIINVFDENTSLIISSWDVFISNQDGSNVYNSSSNNNPLSINNTLLPTGEDISILVSADNYEDRIYYLDISSNGFYTLDVYLPESSYANLYVIRVVDVFDQALKDAFVKVFEFDNGSGIYQPVSSSYTDANGETSVSLYPSIQYKLNISCSGYRSITVKEYRPDPVYYGIYYPKTFELQALVSEPDIYDFWDYITFTAVMYENNSIFVNYVDSLSGTIDVTFRVFEVYNYSEVFVSIETSMSNSFCFWVYGINVSRQHRVVIYLNHSVLGYNLKSILVGPIYFNQSDLDDKKSDFENKWYNVFGDNFDIDIVNMLFIYIPSVLILVLLAKKEHPEIGTVVCGLWIAFIGTRLSVDPVVYALAPFIIALGIILAIVKGGTVKV